jgi:uncharacterized protein
MKAGVISDIHSELEKLEKIKKELIHNNVGVVFIAGDFTNEGSPKITQEALDKLSFARVFAVPGNMDSENVLQTLEENNVSVHKKKKLLNGYSIIGCGGAKPVNTYYPFNVGELEAKKAIETLIEENAEKTIILTHNPPYNVLDKTGGEINLGLRELKKLIVKKQPLACFCGHVHEAKGLQRIGKTLCINPGSVKDGNAAIVEIEENKKDKISVEWIKV